MKFSVFNKFLKIISYVTFRQPIAIKYNKYNIPNQIVVFYTVILTLIDTQKIYFLFRKGPSLLYFYQVHNAPHGVEQGLKHFSFTVMNNCQIQTHNLNVKR